MVYQGHSKNAEPGEPGAYNGDLGRIEAIDAEEKDRGYSLCTGRMATMRWNRMDQLEHAYAVTVHKSQGSEFQHGDLASLLRRQRFSDPQPALAAITRAKEK